MGNCSPLRSSSSPEVFIYSGAQLFSVLPRFTDQCVSEADRHDYDRDALRYDFDHAIPAEDTFRGKHIPPGQRLSIMIRVRAVYRLNRIYSSITFTELVSSHLYIGQEGHSFSLAEAGRILSFSS